MITVSYWFIISIYFYKWVAKLPPFIKLCKYFPLLLFSLVFWHLSALSPYSYALACLHGILRTGAIVGPPCPQRHAWPSQRISYRLYHGCTFLWPIPFLWISVLSSPFYTLYICALCSFCHFVLSGLPYFYALLGHLGLRCIPHPKTISQACNSMWC